MTDPSDAALHPLPAAAPRGDMGANRRALLADADPPCLVRGLGRQLSQQGRQSDAARMGLCFQLHARGIVETNGDRLPPYNLNRLRLISPRRKRPRASSTPSSIALNIFSTSASSNS